MEMIKAENLTYEYHREEDGRKVIAIDDVSIQIQKGSFTAIIGRNGSGKSTFAKNINALLTPTFGNLYVGGLNTRDPQEIWKLRQTAGMVFQNPDNQIVSSVVEDDIAFGPENLGVEPDMIRRRVEESLKSVGMYEQRKKAPHLLSGGQKQRIAIAGVIAMKPQCIVFDEPTAMLDPKGRREVLKIIKKLNKEDGITAVLITHFMEEAASADRVIIMDEGKVKLDGTPKEVFSQVNELKKYGLRVPFVTELAYRMNHKGIDIPKNILTVEEMVDYLCQLK